MDVASASGLVSNSIVTREIGSDGVMFRADYSGHNGVLIISTLTTLTMVTALVELW